MASRNVTRAPAKTLPQSGARPVEVPLQGLLNRNWLAFEHDTAAAVDPHASTGALVAWCWAEVKVLRSTAKIACTALAHDRDAVGADDLEAMLLQRLEPLEDVLRALADKLAQESESH